jgi:hypothetical protein
MLFKLSSAGLSINEGQEREFKIRTLIMRSFTALFPLLLFTTGHLCAQPYATVREYESAIRQQFDEDSGFVPDSLKERLHDNMRNCLRVPAVARCLTYPSIR